MLDAATGTCFCDSCVTAAKADGFDLKAAQRAMPAAAAKEKQAIGIQIGSISFLDEGTDKVLGIIYVERGCLERRCPGQIFGMKLANLAAVGEALREMKIAGLGLSAAVFHRAPRGRSPGPERINFAL